MTQLARKYFPCVDGLRTICVALVMLNHISNVPRVIGAIPTWLGVDIFFLVSGFIITTLLLREEKENGHIDLPAFYVRRFFRIVPLYLTILSVYFVLGIRNAHRWQLLKHYAWYYLTFCGEFIKLLPSDRNNIPPFGATWTLGIEEKFYLIWPLAFFILPPRKWRLAIIPVLMMAVLPLEGFWLMRSYLGLLLGCLLALVLRHASTSRLIEQIPAAVCVLAVFGGFYLVSKHWGFFIVFDLAGMLLLGSILIRDSWLSKGLSLRPLVWLGRRSYSMYLLHTFSLDVIEHFVHAGTVFRTILILVCGMAIAAAGADVTYRLIEEPCRIYGKRLLARRAHTASSMSPAAR
jgi:peptidoglycan/LPS O-acetylase OafA/YrhL